MLDNKKLLLAGKTIDTTKGIWEITVGQNPGVSQYGWYVGGYGSIIKLFNDNKIYGTNGEYWTVESFTRISSNPKIREDLLFSEIHMPNLSETTIYVHLKKGSDIYSKTYVADINDRYPYVTEVMVNLFNSSDLGKTYRMYIGNLSSPPPWL